MKSFEIYDEINKKTLGVLLYYEKDHTFVAELKEDVDEWTAPFLFSGFVKKGIYTISREISYLWVKERLIPSGRQNIGAILSTHKLREYSEIRLLEIAEGRCVQDSLCVRRIHSLPTFVIKRQRRNLTDCVALADREILCIFADESIKKVDLDKFTEIAGIEKVMKNEALFLTCSISPGGYAATFNNSIDIPAYELYQSGKNIPLKYTDLKLLIKRNIVDTQEGCEIAGCSRQNLSYLVQKGLLTPLKENMKGNLYLKGDVQKNGW